MDDLVVENLHKRFEGKTTVTALDGVSLVAKEGELVVLLGPSGCGKTTTLRCIAGLENPDRGSIRLGDQTLVDTEAKILVPPHRRSLGLVFQSFALWPHMTAAQNIGFPLKARGVSSRERKAAVSEIGALVELGDTLLRKRPGQLSGGQQQRVALARALIARERLILFDEPLSNLDAQLREQLRGDLRALHRSVGFTGIFVTHDLTEALSLGDRVAVILDGSVAQLGTPQDVFEQPDHASVALLLGFRRFLNLEVGSNSVHAAEGEVSGLDRHNITGGASIYVRPEFLELLAPTDQPDAEHVRLRNVLVTDVAYLGSSVEVTVEHATGTMRLLVGRDANGRRFTAGDHADLAAKHADIRVYAQDEDDAVASFPTNTDDESVPQPASETELVAAREVGARS